MGVRIRDLTRADLQAVGTVLYNAFNAAASERGYAPRLASVDEGTAWAWSILRHGGGHFLVAELENRVAGLCCLNTRGRNGSIGPVAVDPSCQGRGLGRALVAETLARGKALESIRLFQEAFNPASFSLYYSFGLIPVADLLDLSLVSCPSATAERRESVLECTAADLEALDTYDRPKSGFERRSDLAYFLKWGKVFARLNGEQVRGFLACLPAAQSVQLGPMLADGEEEASSLLEHAVAAFDGKACQIRLLARHHSVATRLHQFGFRLYCLDVLMVRGSWQPDRYVEAFARFPEGA